jgi:hypothetical protein
MFIPKPSDEKSGLDHAIDEVLSEMAGVSSDSDEYAQMVDQLSKLYSMKESSTPPRISPDTLAIVAGNLLGIVLIVGYERANVVTSKALSLILKLR